MVQLAIMKRSEPEDRIAESTLIVTARFFARFRDAAGTDRIALTAPTGATAGELWPLALVACPGLAAAQPLAAVSGLAVNGRWAKPDHPLHDGDEVAYLPPVSGG